MKEWIKLATLVPAVHPPHTCIWVGHIWAVMTCALVGFQGASSVFSSIRGAVYQEDKGFCNGCK